MPPATPARDQRVVTYTRPADLDRLDQLAAARHVSRSTVTYQLLREALDHDAELEPAR